MSKHSHLSYIFNAMKQRCYNTKHKYYNYYGGRGITVCEDWNNRELIKGIKGCVTIGFINFKKWAISCGYREGLTIDRIDVNKGYSPSNCHWVSMKEQNNNTRRSYLITYKNKEQTLAQWCEELNLPYNTIKWRLYHGWSINKAFELPIRRK